MKEMAKMTRENNAENDKLMEMIKSTDKQCQKDMEDMRAELNNQRE